MAASQDNRHGMEDSIATLVKLTCHSAAADVPSCERQGYAGCLHPWHTHYPITHGRSRTFGFAMPSLVICSRSQGPETRFCDWQYYTCSTSMSRREMSAAQASRNQPILIHLELAILGVKLKIGSEAWIQCTPGILGDDACARQSRFSVQCSYGCPSS